jgi:hypothetical protein
MGAYSDGTCHLWGSSGYGEGIGEGPGRVGGEVGGYGWAVDVSMGREMSTSISNEDKGVYDFSFGLWLSAWFSKR